MQWGVGAPYSDGYSVTTLPIPFSNTDYTVIANSSWLNSGAVMASAALSVTQIKVRNGGYTDTYHFLTIGRQQWGRSTAATLNFSLPFQKFYCIATAQESWSGATFENTSWIARTNSSITWPTYLSTNINYIAVGMQQCFKRCALGKAQALPMDNHQKPAQPLPLS